MPVYSRAQLRLALGRERLRDTYVSRTTSSANLGGGATSSFQFMDVRQANLTYSGQGRYQGAYLLWSGLGWPTGEDRDYRVASFNCGSGGFLLNQYISHPMASGDSYELHTLLSPREKNLALDVVIERLWDRQEYPIWAVENLAIYSLPAAVKSVLGVGYYSDPVASLDRGRGAIDRWSVVTTATGQELRISPTLPASYQLVIDAEVALSLGLADVATVNIPDRELVLDGAAAWCYELLAVNAPGQETARYRAEAQRYSRKWALGLGRSQPQVDRKMQLESEF